MPRSRLPSGGFTLVELAVTLTVLGLLLAFSVPAFQQINRSYRLKNAVQHAAGEMRMWRERAIASGETQWVHFHSLSNNANWHIHSGTQLVWGGRFPNGVTLYTSTASPKFTKEGRVSPDIGSNAGWVVLQMTQNGQVRRDTVSVLSSGLVLVR